MQPLKQQMADRRLDCSAIYQLRRFTDSVFVEELEASTTVPLTFTLPLRNKEELEDLLQKIYDPSNEAYYQKYLTPEEFHARFSPSQKDYDKVISYASAWV